MNWFVEASIRLVMDDVIMMLSQEAGVLASQAPSISCLDWCRYNHVHVTTEYLAQVLYILLSCLHSSRGYVTIYRVIFYSFLFVAFVREI